MEMTSNTGGFGGVWRRPRVSRTEADWASASSRYVSIKRGLACNLILELSAIFPLTWVLRAVLMLSLLIVVTAGQAKEVSLAVRAHLGAEEAVARWQPTADLLSEQIEGHTFRLIPYTSLDNMAAAALNGEFEYAITNPSSYVEMEVNAGAERMLSLVTEWQGQPLDRFGSVVFTRSEQADILSLQDLRGKSLIAVSKRAFGGWQMVLKEFLDAEIEPDSYLSKLLFANGVQQNVVYAVRDGRTDAGVVRTGVLEKMAAEGLIDLADFHIVASRSVAGFPFRLSTSLYPEWVITNLPAASEALTRQIRQLLNAVEPQSAAAIQGRYVGWQDAIDYSAVRLLLRELKIAPYENYGAILFRDALWKYRYTIFAFAFSVTLLFCALLLAVRRNAQLSQARGEIIKYQNSELAFQKAALDEHAIVSVTDTRGLITYVNCKFVEISGYSEKELLGQNHRLLKSGMHDAEFYKDIWRTIKSGNTWSGEIMNRRKDGSIYWVQSTIVPQMGENGNPEKYVAIRTDITNAKAAQANLQLGQFLNLVEDEVYMFWPGSLKLFFANRVAQDVSGMGECEFFDLTPIDISIGIDEDLFRSGLASMENGTRDSLLYEVDRTFADGRTVPSEIRLQYIVPDGLRPRFVATVTDISERRRADKAKAEFISTVSHELRTPLTSIKGSLGLLKAGVGINDPSMLSSMVKVAYSNTERLTALVNDILDWEKIEANKMTYRWEGVEIRSLIRDAIEANQGYAKEHGVRFVTKTIPEVRCKVDRGRIMQVMANLLSNAAKFSHESGNIEVSAQRVGAKLRVSVQDFGCGIPKGAQGMIFDRFVQADSSDVRRKGGTGLGLSISRAIVQAHSGSIDFISTEGEGTTMFFDLPVQTESVLATT